jgi:hypothetical protein
MTGDYAHRNMDGGLAVLSSEGIEAAPMLRGRRYELEEYSDGQWVNSGILQFPAVGAALNGEDLLNLQFHEPAWGLRYGYGQADEHRAGELSFTDDLSAFIGTTVGEAGTSRLVRGTVPKLTYRTRRRPRGTGDQYGAWLDFTIENRWESDGAPAPVLVTHYSLGDQDLSDRAPAVTRVDHGKTTIAMNPSIGPAGGDDSFEIVIEWDASSFAGSYSESSYGPVYEWLGSATSESMRAARGADALTGGSRVVAEPLATPATAPPSPPRGEGSLSVQVLHNIQSIQKVATHDGSQEVTTDLAQARTGRYLNLALTPSEAIG